MLKSKLTTIFIFTSVLFLLCFPVRNKAESRTLNEIYLEELSKIEVPEEGFTFVVWGDCRDDNGVFDDVVAKINELDPVFSIGLGDYVSSGKQEQYDAFMPRVSKLEQPLISVIGNHDVQNDGRDIWLDIFGETNFSMVFGGVCFIFLDNSDYVLDDEELALLEGKLDTDMPKMVFAHVPPDYERWSVHCFKKGSDKFLKLLEKYEADYAFFGHIHLFDELQIGPTTAIITGGAGSPLYRMYRFGGANIHVTKVTVTPEGISHEVVYIGK